MMDSERDDSPLTVRGHWIYVICGWNPTGNWMKFTSGCGPFVDDEAASEHQRRFHGYPYTRCPSARPGEEVMAEIFDNMGKCGGQVLTFTTLSDQPLPPAETKR